MPLGWFSGAIGKIPKSRVTDYAFICHEVGEKKKPNYLYVKISGS
jgi:hypothetical protein